MVKPKLKDGENKMKRTKPQLTAQVMRPGHPQWPDFYSRLREAFTNETGNTEFTPLIKRILEEMGFTEFDIELTVLYLFKRWAMQL
jgi:hypothetical protein